MANDRLELDKFIVSQIAVYKALSNPFNHNQQYKGNQDCISQKDCHSKQQFYENLKNRDPSSFDSAEIETLKEALAKKITQANTKEGPAFFQKKASDLNHLKSLQTFLTTLSDKLKTVRPGK